jgi:hypothetical protein
MIGSKLGDSPVVVVVVVGRHKLNPTLLCVKCTDELS